MTNSKTGKGFIAWIEGLVIHPKVPDDVVSRNTKMVLFGLFALVGFSVIFYAVTVSLKYNADSVSKIEPEIINQTILASEELSPEQKVRVLANHGLIFNFPNSLTANDAISLLKDLQTILDSKELKPEQKVRALVDHGLIFNLPNPLTANNTQTISLLNETQRLLASKELKPEQKVRVLAINPNPLTANDTISLLEDLSQSRMNAAQASFAQLEQLNAVYIACISGSIALGGTLISQLWGRR